MSEVYRTRDTRLDRIVAYKVLSNHGNYMASIAIDPVLDDLRDDPRFATLSQKVIVAKLD